MFDLPTPFQRIGQRARARPRTRAGWGNFCVSSLARAIARASQREARLSASHPPRSPIFSRFCACSLCLPPSSHLERMRRRLCVLRVGGERRAGIYFKKKNLLLRKKKKEKRHATLRSVFMSRFFFTKSDFVKDRNRRKRERERGLARLFY